VTDQVYDYACEDPGDPNWTLGVPEDQATTGRWARGDPIGTEYNGEPVQSEDDHTPDPGVQCFVTGVGLPGGTAGEGDVDGGCTTLVSPTFDLTGAQSAYLTYWRWYAEGGNSTDDEFAVDLSSDGGTNWVPLERVPDNAAAWNRVSVDLATLITLTDQVVVRFVACDLGTGGLVDAAIDDISLEAFIPNTVGAPSEVISPVFRLDPARPNPFSREVAVSFSLERAGMARVTVYDVQGRLVRTLLDGSQSSGPHHLVWNGQDERGATASSGIYFLRLEASDGRQVRKLIRLE
jgi:hypothetical protein